MNRAGVQSWKSARKILRRHARGFHDFACCGFHALNPCVFALSEGHLDRIDFRGAAQPLGSNGNGCYKF
jgi:hypothetical protein